MPDGPTPPEAQKAAAAVHDIADAPKEAKKEMVVDHALVMSEVQLLLAEKRTSFALLRTGVTVCLLPLSVAGVLVATSGFWSPFDIWWMLIPLALVLGAFLLLGVYLIFHAMDHLAHNDKVLMGLRSTDTLLEDLLVSHGWGERVVKPWRWKREDPLKRRRSGPPSS